VLGLPGLPEPFEDQYNIQRPDDPAAREAMNRALEDPSRGVEVYLNGHRLCAQDKDHPLHVGDTLVLNGFKEPSVVDVLARLANEPETTGMVAADPPAPDPYVVVPCVNPEHRRINDIIVPDLRCQTCLGLGIVRVLREHVPVVHLREGKWARGVDVVSRLADLNGPPV